LTIGILPDATFFGDDRARSLEDKATYVKWCLGAFVVYRSVSLLAVAVILANHLSRLPMQFAGN
jgi:hypothetical protein